MLDYKDDDEDFDFPWDCGKDKTCSWAIFDRIDGGVQPGVSVIYRCNESNRGREMSLTRDEAFALLQQLTQSITNMEKRYCRVNPNPQ